MSRVHRSLTHKQSVRLLYKTVLRLHRGLPAELKALGDEYARAEFRRHKEASAENTAIFMTSWAEYVQQLSRQLIEISRDSAAADASGGYQLLGRALSTKQLDELNDEQLVQLHELLQETQQPTPAPDNVTSNSAAPRDTPT